MKKYGQADLMCFLVHVYLTEHMESATADEKKQVEDKCRSEIMKKYPSAMDMEVENDRVYFWNIIRRNCWSFRNVSMSGSRTSR